jgi:glycosyltransferase involved in cell wall biosynthesis
MTTLKTAVDLLIVNNVPSFYKVNLYNELAKHCQIHVIFLCLTDQALILKTFKQDIRFSYDLISEAMIEKRNKWRITKCLFSLCRQYEYKKIIYGGYLEIELRAMMFLTPKRKNCLQFESSIKESSVTGIKALIKKILFSRVSTALPAGELHEAVFKALGFGGNISITNGVGIIHKHDRKAIPRVGLSEKSANGYRYLFVGRLIEVKNLVFTIRVFNKTGKHLTIVGTGSLNDKLRTLAERNINFLGFIPNDKIHDLFMNYDVLILPSLSETWGLVVEEAVFSGVPVLASDAVGCKAEMIIKPQTGIVFSPLSETSLENAMDRIEEAYAYYQNSCIQFDFKQKDSRQVSAYLSLLEK